MHVHIYAASDGQPMIRTWGHQRIQCVFRTTPRALTIARDPVHVLSELVLQALQAFARAPLNARNAKRTHERLRVFTESQGQHQRPFRGSGGARVIDACAWTTKACAPPDAAQARRSISGGCGRTRNSSGGSTTSRERSSRSSAPASGSTSLSCTHTPPRGHDPSYHVHF